MSDEFKNWKKNPDATINIQPVIDWQCAPFTIVGVVRLRFAPERDRLDHPEILQLGMSAAQCTVLAEDLLRMAATLMALPKPGTPSH